MRSRTNVRLVSPSSHASRETVSWTQHIRALRPCQPVRYCCAVRQEAQLRTVGRSRSDSWGDIAAGSTDGKTYRFLALARLDALEAFLGKFRELGDSDSGREWCISRCRQIT